eukprot:Amastigsp_a840985_17343.p2 type:complete len:158 gc:universal Amastigsp_a840985_17343:510-37(-)
MGHYGYRAKTRHLFKRDFRANGMIGLSKYLTTYKVGQYVDIKGNGSIQKGMPHKTYHGRTGIVYNVTQRGLGIEVQKVVRNKILKKRISIRIEHVHPSKCRDDFLARVKVNDAKKAAAAKAGTTVNTKRTPILPRAGFIVRNKNVKTIAAQPYEDLF